MKTLLRHLSGESQGRFPVWMMRQAGRYLPSYQKLKERYSFWEMVTNAELSVEVSLLPLKELPLDAVILYSDILTPVYGLGVPIEIKESVGPLLANPFKEPNDFSILKQFDPELHTPYVEKALQSLKTLIPTDTTLIGFGGAPWTLSHYLVPREKGLSLLNHWYVENPSLLLSSLENVTQMTLKYLLYQIRSGAEVIQLFDTWLSEMNRDLFKVYYKPLLQEIFFKVRSLKIPVIYFVKNASHLMDLFWDLHIDILSVDHLCTLTEYEQFTRKKFSLQGNLDPSVLLLDSNIVRRETRKLVLEASTLSKPPILNLGHGILPKTPIASAAAFVSEASRLWI